MATSTLGSGTLVLAGTTSGTTTVTATAVAGTTTLTLPAATDTLVGKATTDTLTNKTLTGAAMNGTLGATTPSTASVTTLTTSSTITHNGGTANGVAYLDGSKVLTTGSALVFDGTNLGVGVTPSAWTVYKVLQMNRGSFVSSGTNAFVGSNWFYDGADKYITTDYASFYRQSSGAHTWATAPSGTAGNAITFTQAMTLDASGNLLVGTTSAQGGTSTFAVDGNVKPVLAINNTNSISQSDQSIRFVRNGSTVGTISTTLSATAYNTSSDYRLKNTIAPMTGSLAKVAALKPVTYKWNVDGSDGEGFIAHELAEVCPQAVTGEKDAVETQQYEISPAVPATFDEDGNELTPFVEAVMGERKVPKYQGIDTSFLVATLTAAIQEQQALITQLQADVLALKGA